ncbi:MAG: ABC transporter ATP-binding protein [Rhodospirillales bacterium]
MSSSPPPAYAVEVVDLAKIYAGKRNKRGIVALDKITLRIPVGAFFGLIGPNGAGKSTLINILAGLVLRTAGAATVWGFDIEQNMRAARRAIGVVPQELNLDPFFSPRELLEVQAGLYGVPKHARRTDAILNAVGLSAQANAYARRLSGGMRRRLLVAKAMVHSPKVLVLDEPTAGVDVELRRHLWAYLKALNAAGTTILLTTHYLEEVEALCDSVAIINHGRLVACDTTKALLAQLDHKTLTVTLADPLTDIPAALAGYDAKLAGPDRLIVQYPPSRIHGGEILSRLAAAGLVIVEVSTRESELEDIFLKLTSEPAEPSSASLSAIDIAEMG